MMLNSMNRLLMAVFDKDRSARQDAAEGHVTVRSDFVEEECTGSVTVEFDDFILQRATENCVSSPIIYIGGTQWVINLNDEDDEDEDDSEVYLSCGLENQGMANMSCSFQLSILGKLKLTIQSPCQSSKSCIEPGASILFPCFISRSKLHSGSRGLLVDGKLTIKVDLTIYRNVYTRPEAEASSPPASTLAGGLQTLFYQETYPPDIAITAFCADEPVPIRTKRKRAAKGDFTTASISAHKAILVARSPVFAAMFTGSMQEATAAEVFVSDCSDQVMHAFVEFLYTDICSVSVLYRHAEQLLEAACKYQVPALQTVCVNFLTRQLTATNAVRVLVLADLHNLSELRERALAWTTRNLKTTVQSAEFQAQAMSAELCHDLLQRLAQTT